MKLTQTYKIWIVIALLGVFAEAGVSAKKIPFVYNVENRGEKFAKPAMPDLSQLPVIELLTDPFAWSNGKGRSTKFRDWSKRRNEIGAEIQHYEIGIKPVRPKNIKAEYENDTLTVKITVNGETLTLTSNIILPEGKGPFPAVIGIGRGSGSLPPDLFSTRNIVQIPFNFAQVMAWQQKRGSEPINKLYPEFLNLILNTSNLWEFAIARSVGSVSKRIKWEDLSKYRFSLPREKKEQQQIVALFQNIEKALDQVDGQEKNLKALQKSLAEGLIIPEPKFGNLLNKKNFLKC